MVLMVDCKQKIEFDCRKEDFLDYRNILVLIYVINEVFHRKFEQDHSLLEQELIKPNIRRFSMELFQDLTW